MNGSKGFMPVHYVDVTALADFKVKYIRCYASQNINDKLVDMTMEAARSRGGQLQYSAKVKRLAECFAPLSGFHAQGSPCIFAELPVLK